MNDEAIDNTMDNNISEYSDIAGDAISNGGGHVSDTISYHSVSDTILGLIFCFCILGAALYLSQMYNIEEREELAEAERNRVKAEKERIHGIETYRSKIAKVIDSYAIHLTNRSTSMLNCSRHAAVAANKTTNNNKNINRTIPNGNENEPIGTNTIKTVVSESEDDEDIDIDIDIEESSTGNNNRKLVSSSSNEDDNSTSTWTSNYDINDDQQEEEEEQQDQQQVSSTPSSPAMAIAITRSDLREAVSNNPCAFCLEPFHAGDDIVCCSNINIVRGQEQRKQKPHCFHQACSLDYLVSHSDGIHAPCPCCRKVLLSSSDDEGQRRKGGSLKHSHHSALTLPDLNVVEQPDNY